MTFSAPVCSVFYPRSDPRANLSTCTRMTTGLHSAAVVDAHGRTRSLISRLPIWHLWEALEPAKLRLGLQSTPEKLRRAPQTTRREVLNGIGRYRLYSLPCREPNPLNIIISKARFASSMHVSCATESQDGREPPGPSSGSMECAFLHQSLTL